MTLEELIPKLAGFKKIVVTGPQRSGTTISTKIIARLLEYEVHCEEEFDVDNILLFCKILSAPSGESTPGGVVLQAPGLSSIVHLLAKSDVAVVFLIRDINEIVKSEIRIDWNAKGYEQYEKQKYFYDSPVPISEMKYKVWNDFQKEALGARCFELDYNSLESHSLWIEKEARVNFDARQTEILLDERAISVDSASDARPAE